MLGSETLWPYQTTFSWFLYPSIGTRTRKCFNYWCRLTGSFFADVSSVAIENLVITTNAHQLWLIVIALICRGSRAPHTIYNPSTISAIFVAMFRERIKFTRRVDKNIIQNIGEEYKHSCLTKPLKIKTFCENHDILNWVVLRSVIWYFQVLIAIINIIQIRGRLLYRPCLLQMHDVAFSSSSSRKQPSTLFWYYCFLFTTWGEKGTKSYLEWSVVKTCCEVHLFLLCIRSHSGDSVWHPRVAHVPCYCKPSRFSHDALSYK